MNLTRTAVTAGIAALSLAASATPAFAKGGGDGGGDINNTVISISPLAPAPTTDTNTSGGRRSGRPATCVAVGVDPITGSILMSCSQTGA
jgi:hypothetical protein